MQIRIFHISSFADENEQEFINKFLRSHRILQVDRCFSPENGGYWSIFVTYQENVSIDGIRDFQRRNKVDYREVLSESAFHRFEEMRQIRGNIAKKEGIAAFLVFSDKELAKLAEVEYLTASVLENIEGVDEKKKKKYGELFLSNQKMIQEDET